MDEQHPLRIKEEIARYRRENEEIKQELRALREKVKLLDEREMT